MLDLCIYHKDVSFVIDKNITRHYIPNLVLTVPEKAILSGLLEAEGSQIGVNLEMSVTRSLTQSLVDSTFSVKSSASAVNTLEAEIF